jgi:hypothetical protein
MKEGKKDPMMFGVGGIFILEWDVLRYHREKEKLSSTRRDSSSRITNNSNCQMMVLVIG